MSAYAAVVTIPVVRVVARVGASATSRAASTAASTAAGWDWDWGRRLRLTGGGLWQATGALARERELLLRYLGAA